MKQSEIPCLGGPCDGKDMPPRESGSCFIHWITEEVASPPWTAQPEMFVDRSMEQEEVPATKLVGHVYELHTSSYASDGIADLSKGTAFWMYMGRLV